MGSTVRGRIPMGARFSTPFQTGPGAHPTYTMGTGSYPGVKRPGLGVDHPPPYSAKVKERVSYTATPPMGLRGLLKGELYLYLSNFLVPAFILIIIIILALVLVWHKKEVFVTFLRLLTF